jgi:hypothetical protein
VPVARQQKQQGFWLRLVRVGAPSAMVIGGLVTAAVLQDDIGVGIAIVLVGGGLLVAGSAWVIGMGLASNVDREREEETRREFSRRGLWPRPPNRRGP